MTKFKSDIPVSFKNILKGCSIPLCAIFLLGIFNLLSTGYKIKDTVFIALAILFLIQLLQDLFMNRLAEICFDDNNRTIFFSYKSLLNGTRVIQLPFDKASILVSKYRTNIFKPKQELTIYFFNEKTMFFKVSTEKDGFTKLTLENICNTTAQIPIEVAKQ